MVDQCTANTITSLQKQARNERKILEAIQACHKPTVVRVCALEKRKRSLGRQSRHDWSLIQKLKSLNKDIDDLEIFHFPGTSVTYIPKLVKEKDISQLLGTYELCETIADTDAKSDLKQLEEGKTIQFIKAKDRYPK